MYCFCICFCLWRINTDKVLLTGWLAGWYESFNKLANMQIISSACVADSFCHVTNLQAMLNRPYVHEVSKDFVNKCVCMYALV